MGESSKRGRYCVARLLDCLLTSSPFLPQCVKELYLDTFDCDGFTIGLFHRVLGRFPYVEVFSYDVRHFVLSTFLSVGQHLPTLPESTAGSHRFSQVHISISEYGTCSAFARYLGLFDEIEELSIGHLELEDDGDAHFPRDFRKVHARVVVKETQGKLSSENVRILCNVLDTTSIISIHDETVRGQFVGFMDDFWKNSNVQHLAIWYPAAVLAHLDPPPGVLLSKFPNLRTVDLALDFVQDTFGDLIDVVKSAPSTLREIKASIMIPYLQSTINPSDFRRYFLPIMTGLDWDLFESALQWLSSTCPKADIQFVMLLAGAERHLFSRTSHRISTQGNFASREHTHELDESLQDALFSYLSDPLVRANVRLTVVLCE